LTQPAIDAVEDAGFVKDDRLTTGDYVEKIDDITLELFDSNSDGINDSLRIKIQWTKRSAKFIDRGAATAQEDFASLAGESCD